MNAQCVAITDYSPWVIVLVALPSNEDALDLMTWATHKCEYKNAEKHTLYYNGRKPVLVLESRMHDTYSIYIGQCDCDSGLAHAFLRSKENNVVAGASMIWVVVTTHGVDMLLEGRRLGNFLGLTSGN